MKRKTPYKFIWSKNTTWDHYSLDILLERISNQIQNIIQILIVRSVKKDHSFHKIITQKIYPYRIPNDYLTYLQFFLLKNDLGRRLCRLPNSVF